MRRVRRRRPEQLDDLASQGRTGWGGTRRRDASIPGSGYPGACADEFGLTVRSGPFAGLRFYVTKAAVGAPRVADCLPAKLIGCYEQELHPGIERLLGSSPSTIVNVGAAEGYYAVGLAMRAPGSRVHAFEPDTDRREMLRDNVGWLARERRRG